MGWLRRYRVWRRRTIIGFVGGGVEVDVALHEVGGVANNGFGRFLGDRAGGINVGKVVVVGTEYAAGHAFVFVLAQASVNLYRNGRLDECGGGGVIFALKALAPKMKR